MVEDILRRARAMIATEAGWGDRCALLELTDAWSEIPRAGVFDQLDLLEHAENVLMEAVHDDNIPWWNDSHSHAEVLAGFDAAIAIAEEMERARE